jgi:hypothetical protein
MNLTRHPALKRQIKALRNPPEDIGWVVECVECGRSFNLLDVDDNAEWVYGHDCEEDGQ